jgi:hypothetical protein
MHVLYGRFQIVNKNYFDNMKRKLFSFLNLGQWVNETIWHREQSFDVYL